VKAPKGPTIWQIGTNERPLEPLFGSHASRANRAWAMFGYASALSCSARERSGNQG